MGVRRVMVGVVWGLLLVGCGVPRGAAELAGREEAVLGTAGQDDSGVRTALAGQGEAWEAMVGLVERRELFGTAVGANFTELVRRTAALARRQEELIARGQDDPELNRQVLERLRRMWGDVRRYLGE